jgi:hypothetical protein
MDILATSKLTPHLKRSQVYPYYAGFSASFVKTLLEYLGVEHSDVVLDPWNGSGTTTAVCAENGIKAIGVDINPFMRVVSNFKLLPNSSVTKACRALLECLPAVIEEVPSEGLPHKMGAAFTLAMRANHAEINEHVLHLFVANAVRQIYGRAKTKNPTWFSIERISQSLIKRTDLLNTLRSEVEGALAKLDTLELTQPQTLPKIETANFINWKIPSEVSHVITSPPYLTRLDYVKKTLPELLYLSEFEAIDLGKLRSNMTGSVLTGRFVISKETFSISDSKTAVNVLDQIERHASKASTGYYLKFYGKYFSDMQSSIRNITKSSVRSSVFVTQASYYKEIYVDLPKIIAEMFRAGGFEEQSRVSFAPTNSIVTVNKASYASAQLLPSETVSIFEAA